MKFRDRYNLETVWFGKVIVMEIYHLTMRSRIKKWTITNTAKYFQCSTGLVSENLRLADAIHHNHKLCDLTTRQEALKKMNTH